MNYLKREAELHVEIDGVILRKYPIYFNSTRMTSREHYFREEQVRRAVDQAKTELFEYIVNKNYEIYLMATSSANPKALTDEEYNRFLNKINLPL